MIPNNDPGSLKEILDVNRYTAFLKIKKFQREEFVKEFDIF